tara:strand:+ start:713 stop:1345 length:633 start_codon:yes stop_codon:yes gene_type:complete
MRISTNIANTVSLQYANGEVMYISDGDIAGLQIKYECTGNIHINVPDSWLYHSNSNTIIMASLEGKGNIIDGSTIIEYNGDMKITSARIVTWDYKSWSIKPHNKIDNTLYPLGSIVKTTDQISNQGGLGTIASANKKFYEYNNVTFKQRLEKENIKNSNFEDIKKKAEEELAANVGGVVVRDLKIKTKPTKTVSAQLAQPAKGKGGGGGY